MKKSYYLSQKADERKTWLNNFAAKIGGYATLFGLTTAEVTAITTMAAFYSYIIDLALQVKGFKENLTDFIKILSSSPEGTTLPAVPTFTPGTAPTASVAGIFPFITRIVKRIKAHENYKTNIGEDLRIIGDEQELDESTLKLDIAAEAQGNGVQISFKKNGADGAHIYSNPIGRFATDEWELIGVDFHSPYLDSRAVETAGKPENRRYMAKPVVDDKEVGLTSKIVSVTYGPELITGTRVVTN
jgi:hypothetical protein